MRPASPRTSLRRGRWGEGEKRGEIVFIFGVGRGFFERQQGGETFFLIGLFFLACVCVCVCVSQQARAGRKIAGEASGGRLVCVRRKNESGGWTSEQVKSAHCVFLFASPPTRTAPSLESAPFPYFLSPYTHHLRTMVYAPRGGGRGGDRGGRGAFLFGGLLMERRGACGGSGARGSGAVAVPAPGCPCGHAPCPLGMSQAIPPLYPVGGDAVRTIGGRPPRPARPLADIPPSRLAAGAVPHFFSCLSLHPLSSSSQAAAAALVAAGAAVAAVAAALAAGAAAAGVGGGVEKGRETQHKKKKLYQQNNHTRLFLSVSADEVSHTHASAVANTTPGGQGAGAGRGEAQLSQPHSLLFSPSLSLNEKRATLPFPLSKPTPAR